MTMIKPLTITMATVGMLTAVALTARADDAELPVLRVRSAGPATPAPRTAQFPEPINEPRPQLQPLQPIPQGEPLPAVPQAPSAYSQPAPGGHSIPSTAPISLFPRVKYKDLDEIAPCAVPTIVQVPSPCRDRCGCCPSPMVDVMIEAPQHCGPPRVKVKRRGREYVFDYGEYHIDVRLKRKGYIEVDYQD